MGNSPDDINNTLLIGPIDTQKEIKLILYILQKESHLRREITELEITHFLASLKQMRLDGPVDTPREIEIFLEMMRKSNMLCGPIDTPEEIKLFMDKVQALDFLQQSIAKVNQKTAKTPTNSPQKAKKKVDIDEQEDEDENTYHP